MITELIKRINQGEKIVIEAEEYSESYPVRLGIASGNLVVLAINEGGYNCTAVDLRQLLRWVAKNAPELLEEATR